MLQKLAERESQLPFAVAERDEALHYLQSVSLDPETEQQLRERVRIATNFIHSVEDFRNTMVLEVARHEAHKQMIIGIGVVILGALVTGGSYLLASGGGTYVLAWGAIIFGLWRAVTSGLRYSSLTRQLNQS